MSAATPVLPAGFEALEPFVERWSSGCANDRARLRRERSETERKAFFDPVSDFVDRALQLLDAKPFPELDAAKQRLMNLLLAFAHVALAVEMQAEREPMHAAMSQHLPITRAVADVAPRNPTPGDR